MILYQLLDGAEASLHAEKQDSWDHSYIVTNLTSSGAELLVGDVIHSVSVLQLKDGRLSIKARDHSALWPFRIQSLDKGGIVVGNVCSPHFFKISAHILLGRSCSDYIQVSNAGQPHNIGKRWEL